MTDNAPRASTPQDGLGCLLLMFAWSAAWFTFPIYVTGRQFVPDGGTAPTWVLLAVTVLGTGAELVVGLVLLRREGYTLRSAGLRDRIHWHWPKAWKAWAVALVALILGMSLSMAAGPVNWALAGVPGFTPPDWWPAASDPRAEVNSAVDAFVDVALEGNLGFVIPYLAIGLVFNILGEELYYRGYLLLRMRGVFGKCDWVANGVLFTLKHVYQRRL